MRAIATLELTERQLSYLLSLIECDLDRIADNIDGIDPPYLADRQRERAELQVLLALIQLAQLPNDHG